MSDNDNDTQRLLGELHGNSETTKEKLDKLEEKVDNLREDFTKLLSEISLYKTVVKTVRAILLTIVAIAAFKFGDISGHWAGFFDGK